VHTQTGSTTPVDKTQQLQRKLYLAAKGSRNRRFHALYDRIFRSDILWRAWQEVRQNGGSAGSDGLSITDIEQAGVAAFLAQIEQDLKTNTYRPSRCCGYISRNRMAVNDRWASRRFATGWYSRRVRS
jgi:RNA-directed DNA polymerase